MFTAIATYCDNQLNPILLRELRQLVRNRFIVVMLILYISLLALVSTLMVLFGSVADEQTTIGVPLYYTMSSIMVVATSLIVCSYTAMMMATERINSDLLYTTSISSVRIVLGKFLAGFLLSAMLFSATFPFLTVAYLLRGLDISPAILALFLVFFVIQMANALVLYTFAAVKTYTQLVFVGGGMLWLGMMMAGYTCAIPFAIVSMYDNTPLTVPMLLCFTAMFTLIGLFLTAASVLIAPVTTNRMAPMRIAVTTWFVLSFAVVAVFQTAIQDLWVGWFLTNSVLFAVLLIVGVCERDSIGLRVQLEIPRNIFLRFLVFPFFTGTASALVWLAMFGTGLVTAFSFFSHHPVSSSNMVHYPLTWNDMSILITAVLFVYCYSMTAFMVRLCFLKKYLPSTKVPALIFGLLGLGTLGSVVLFFLLFSDQWVLDALDGYPVSILSAANPFMLMYHGPRAEEAVIQNVCSMVWAVLVTIWAAPWFFTQLVRFRPPENVFSPAD